MTPKNQQQPPEVQQQTPLQLLEGCQTCPRHRWKLCPGAVAAAVPAEPAEPPVLSFERGWRKTASSDPQKWSPADGSGIGFGWLLLDDWQQHRVLAVLSVWLEFDQSCSTGQSLVGAAALAAACQLLAQLLC